MFCYDIFELVLASIFYGISLTAFIWRLTKDDKQYVYLEFEMWSLLIQLLYYLFFLIIGISSTFNKASDNKAQKFIKSTLFKFIWPFVVNSGVIFYLGYYLRWFEFNTLIKGNDYYLNLFLHGFSQAGFILDLIIFRRENNKLFFIDFAIITGIYVGYSILLFSIQPSIKSYAFLDKNGPIKKDNIFIISIMIVSYFVYLYLYFIYSLVVDFKSGVRNLFGGDKKNNNQNNQVEEPIKEEKPIIPESEDEESSNIN